MNVAVKLRIQNRQGDAFLGPGPVELLRRIDAEGSIRQAAGKMNMSYMKALKLVRETETNVGQPLVTRRIGGPEGGGSELTSHAHEIINTFETLIRKVLRYAEGEFRRSLGKKLGG